nr:integrase, catalytic region, zinc finger, CCHC-type, peptidase aspartic, catalytic [Tanacetum cinerariifolium]
TTYSPNIKIDSQDVISKVVCAMCSKCLNSINHDKRLCKNVNGKNSYGKNKKAKVSVKEIQMKYQPKVTKSKKVEHHKSLATPKLRKPRFLLRWSPTGRLFDQEGKLAASSNSESQYDYSNGYSDLFMVRQFGLFQAYDRKSKASHQFRLKVYGNCLVGQFCDSDLEVAFRRNACFIRNLEGVDLLKGDRSTNLYTINLHEMASASPICLMARASSTKSWLWHQRLSHVNFDTINDLARNDLVASLPKFKYHKEHLCPSCEQGKSKRVSHPPKPVPNSRQRLQLLYMDLCGPMRIASINGKRSKDEAPVVIITFLKRITVLLQSPVIIIRTDNGTEFKNQVLKVYFDSNDREDIGKLGAKDDIGFFIRYSANSCAYRIYNRRTKKIMEIMNVSFDELSAMAFEQRSSKLGLQCMTSGQISSGLDLTYAPSTITTQQPTEGELDLLFEAMYDDYFGGQPSANVENVPNAQEPQVRQTSTASTSSADNVPIPTNS